MHVGNIYGHRQLMQTNEGSNEFNRNYFALAILIVPILLLVGVSIKWYMESKEKELIERKCRDWTPESQMSFKYVYHDGKKRTPLQVAISTNNLGLVRVFLQNPDFRRFQEDSEKNSELHYASFCGNMGILELVAEATATESFKVNEDKQTALHRAAELARTTQNTDAMVFLLNRFNQEDQLLQDKYGNTFLHTYVLHRKVDQHYGFSTFSFPVKLDTQRQFIGSISHLLNPQIFEIKNKSNFTMITVKPLRVRKSLVRKSSNNEMTQLLDLS